MVQITRDDAGIYHYGDIRYVVADDVYRRWRDDYHASIGRVAFLRLNRLGQRRERVHGRGFVHTGGYKPGVHGAAVPVRLLGIVNGSYWWLLSGRDIRWDMGDDGWGEWIEAAFSAGSGMTRSVRGKR